MLVWITRLLFLLISANVVYGTHGDVYADKVQVLIKPNCERISYSPDINTDLFVAVYKSKESNRADRSYSKSSISLSEWGTFVFLPYATVHLWRGIAESSDEMAYIRNRNIRKMVFPHHYFS
ncbi:MAG: hypothetical protein RJQ14_12070 [Marinoscillum sp.]